MATADELLMATSESSAESTEDILVVDLNTRVISIPATIKILGVESDDDVKRLQFRIPRYYGEFDLSNFDIRINFENARNKGDFYPVNDVVVTDDNNITFSWLVDRVAFLYPGDVDFSICMKLFDSNGIVIKELNTTIATLPVLEGLETEKAVVENNPSAFDQVMFRLYAIEAATGNGQNGHYSIVKVTQTDDGTLFTIVNSDGETIAYVKHGVDGYTPVKGVDYWTDADETEIKQYVIDYTEQSITNWAPAYKTVYLYANAWANNTQMITITGVTTDNPVFVGPEPSVDNYTAYVDAEIRCVSQGTNALSFTCGSTPAVDVLVNVAIYRSSEEIVNGSITVVDDGEGNITIS